MERPADQPMTLTKAEIIDKVIERTGLGKRDAVGIVEVTLDSIIESLRLGTGVELRGLGSFRVRSRKARKGRNPRTGTEIQVKAKRVAFFKTGKELKVSLNKGAEEAHGIAS